MKLNDDKTVLLDEDEVILFGSMMYGLVKGLDEKRASGAYINKNEKEIYEKAREIVEALENAEVL